MARKVLVIVPFPLDEEGVKRRQAQVDPQLFGRELEFHFRAVKFSGARLDSYHDYVLGDAAIYEAGVEAEREGYSAICIDTVSDSGLNALRSRLSVPVIGPGQAMYCIACMLGQKFSVITIWDGWLPLYKKGLAEHGLAHRCASLRSINVRPDLSNLLSGKESEIFPRLEAEARRAIDEDGADVICLGSTTMHQAHGYLAERLPVPVLSPGPLSYKLAELMLSLKLRHSRKAYPPPEVPMDAQYHAMIEAAARISRKQ